MSDVKRYNAKLASFGGQFRVVVLASDFDALQQRCRALEDDNKRMAGEGLLAAQRGVDERNAIITELRVEVERLRKDAERYRWLRDHWYGFEYLRGNQYPWVSLDQEVDRVMSKENSQ